jgi:hypothetical protein
MEKLKCAHGNYVVGEKFWGRETEIRLLTRKINEGAHTLLVAQRRMGKTSLMKELQQRLAKRYFCIYVDLQQANGPEDAIVDLSQTLRPDGKLWGKVKQIFKNAVQGVEELSISELTIKLRAGITLGDWRQKGDQLFSILAEANPPVLLLLDEVPILVNRMLVGETYEITAERKAHVDAFMSWLRDNSQKHQGKIRIILSGSIGLEPVLRRAGLSATVNNFSAFDLEPWDEATAVGCLRALANEYGVQFLHDAEAAMVRKLGYCIPHHVQMFFSHVLDRCQRNNDMEVTPGQVDEIYKNEMLSVRGHAELSHYEDRLQQAFGPKVYPLAFELLTEAAVARVPLKPETITAIMKNDTISPEDADEVLRTLEHDGYFRKTGKGYVFESRLLKDWWANRHRLGYVPVAKRNRQ